MSDLMTPLLSHFAHQRVAFTTFSARFMHHSDSPSHPDDNDLLDLATEEGIGVVLWHVLDDGADGIDLLERLFDRYGKSAAYVVVKNRGRGKDFAPFEASSARATATALGVPVIELPELHGPTMRKVDHQDLSFWAAGNDQDAGLGLMERQRVKVRTRKTYDQFDAAGEALFSKPAIDQASVQPGDPEPRV